MEAAIIEVEVKREAAATRSNHLRKWVGELMERQLDEGVPDAPKVQA